MTNFVKLHLTLTIFHGDFSSVSKSINSYFVFPSDDRAQIATSSLPTHGQLHIFPRGVPNCFICPTKRNIFYRTYNVLALPLFSMKTAGLTLYTEWPRQVFLWLSLAAANSIVCDDSLCEAQISSAPSLSALWESSPAAAPGDPGEYRLSEKLKLKKFHIAFTFNSNRLFSVKIQFVVSRLLIKV